MYPAGFAALTERVRGEASGVDLGGRNSGFHSAKLVNEKSRDVFPRPGHSYQRALRRLTAASS
jgi:hypothetical protein